MKENNIFSFQIQTLCVCIRKEKINRVRVHKEISKGKKQKNMFLPNVFFPSSHLCEFMGIDWSATQGGSAEIFAMHERRRGG